MPLAAAKSSPWLLGIQVRAALEETRFSRWNWLCRASLLSLGHQPTWQSPSPSYKLRKVQCPSRLPSPSLVLWDKANGSRETWVLISALLSLTRGSSLTLSFFIYKRRSLKWISKAC